MTGGPRGGLAAVALVAVLAGLAVAPPYRERLAPSWRQLGLLPERVTATRHDLQASVKGEPYFVAERIRRNTFDTAVILVPDTPADDPLHRVGWLTWFLYPRVLLQPHQAAAAPGLEIDFVLYTDHFHADLDADRLPEGTGLAPVSARAREHLRRLAEEPAR